MTARVDTERSMSTAMDSVLAEYYGPLWEEYHIFGLYTGTGNNAERGEAIAAKLTDYMGYTLQPGTDMVSGKNNVDLYQTSIDSAEVENETYLMDYQGKLIINEAVEYMKYRDIGNGLEQLLGKLSLLETPEKVSYIYEEKQKIEEKLVEIDRGILELMEALDGVKTSKKGIEVTKGGNLKTADYFVKKICLCEVTKESVGINQDQVFLTLQGNYVNPSSDFAAIESGFLNLYAELKQMEELQSVITSEEASLSAKQDQLLELNELSDKTNEDKINMKALKKSINALTDEIEDNESTMEEQKTRVDHWAAAIQESKEKLSELMKGIQPMITKAINAIESIIERTQTAAPLIKQYEDLINSNKEQLEGEVYTGLTESLND